MVQWGDTPDLENTFDMGQFVDDGNWLRDSPSDNGLWRHGNTQRRYITFRIYDSDPLPGAPLKRMICAIYNPNLGTTDGQMRIKASVTVTGLSAQSLEWVFCDDDNECAGTSGNVLSGSHDTTSDLSDGFCVGDFNENGDIINFKFAGIEGLKGFVFEDPTGIVKQYNFGMTPTNGLNALFIDTDGVAVIGSSPDIQFNWQGFLVN